MSFKQRAASFLNLFFASSASNESNLSQTLHLSVEKLEERMMLSGTGESSLFEADFEEVDVKQGQFAFFHNVSGLTATGSPVEIQDNHPSVGPAAQGDQHLELDGLNGVFFDLDSNGQELRLQFEYSARPGIGAEQNAIQIIFNDELIETVEKNGERQKGTKFEKYEIVLPDTNGNARLEFRSSSPGDPIGLGGLLDDIRVYQTLAPIELNAISDQEIQVGSQLSATAELLPPSDEIEGISYSLLNGPQGISIDSQSGVISWVATNENIQASDAANDRTTIGEPQLLFSSGFEDVDVERGGFDFFNELSGFTALGRGVEVQDNHPSVGGASEGRQHLELDGLNRIARDVATVVGDQYELAIDYSARPGVGADTNAIEIYWDGALLETVAADGSNLKESSFNEFRFDLSNFATTLTSLEFRSKVSGPIPGLGGLLDNIRLYRRPVDVNDGVDGKYEVTVQAEAPDGRVGTETFTICIVDGVMQHAPELAPIEDQRIDEEQTLSVSAIATDTDLPDDSLAYSIQSGPDGLAIETSTGQISWTPTEAQGPGQYPVSVRVTDSSELFADVTFNVLVGEVGTPPELAPISNQNITVGETLSVQFAAADSDLPAESLTFELVNAPQGMEIDSETGVLNWTPSAGQGAGEYSVEVQVTDSTGLFAASSFVVVIASANLPPVLNLIEDQTVVPGEQIAFTATVTDPNLDELTFSLGSNAP